MKKKILVIDDQDIARFKLKAPLEKEGYEVLEAKDGVEGLKMVKENPDINLIISDHFMPNMDGLTMCEHLSRNKDFDHIPIIIISTEGGPDAKRRGRAIGIKGWVSKPYNLDNLLKGVKRCLDI